MIATVTKNILLVEDEFIISLNQKRELESKGYKVTILNSAKDVLNSILVNNDNYDLILMDIDLGSDTDGTDVASEILSKKHIPILFLSSHIEEDVVSKTETITSYGYVVKNSGITVLDASIKMAFKLYESNKLIHFKKDYLEAVLNSIGDAVIVTDIDGKVTRLNPVAEELTGWNLQEAQNKELKEVFKIINSLSRNPVENPVDIVLKTNKIVGLANHTALISKNGLEFQIADSGSPIKNLKGETTGVVLVFRDVSKEYEAQSLIAEREKLYRSLFENMLNGFCHCKIVRNDMGQPDLEFVLVNPAFEKLTGIASPTGNRLSDLLPGILTSDAIPIAKLIEVATTGVSVQFETYINTLNKWFIISCYSLNKESFYLAFDEITNRKKAEELLSYQANLLMNVQDSIIGTDPEFNISYWNQGAESLYGWKKEEVIGKQAKDILKTEFTHEERESVIQKLNKDGTYFDEFKQIRKDGIQIFVETHTSKVFDSDGNIQGYIAVSRDVTEKKMFQSQLMSSKDRLDGIVESAMDAIVSIDDDYRIVVFNKASEKLFKYSSDEILGKNINILIPSRFHPNHDTSIKEFGETGVSSRSMSDLGKVVGIRSDGKEIPIEAAISQVRLGNKKIFTAILRDDSSRKKFKEEITKLLAEKESLLQEVNHRTKNNLLIIYSLLNLQSEIGEIKNVKESLLDAASRVKGMMILYDKLYISNGILKIDLNSYLRTLIQEVIDIFPLKIEPEINIPSEQFLIDSKMISTLGIIINELLTNSLKYAFTDKSKNLISVSLNNLNSIITIHYSDNGTNFNDLHTEKISGGFGIEFIESLISGINGSITFDLSKNFKVKIEIPYSLE